MTYFFDEEFAARIDDQMLRVGAWCDEQVRQIAQRVVELAPRDRNTVLYLVDSLRAYEE